MSPMPMSLPLQFVAFGVGFSLVVALAQLSRKQRDLTHYLSAGVSLGNAIAQWFVVVYVTGFWSEHPASLFLVLTTLLALGPTNYLYHYRLLHPDQALPIKVKLQFVPAALVLLADVVFQLFPTESQVEFLRAMFASPLQQASTYLLFMGVIFMLAYSWVPLKLAISAWPQTAIRSQVRVVVLAFAATVISILVITFGFITNSADWVLAGGVTVTLINVMVFLANHRYPDFYRLVEKEVKKVRYERSLLKGLNTDTVQERLEDLMKSEALYKDFDLSLETLAQKLSITPHQLSEFMNERMQTNFRNYINAYRIEEAKKILQRDSDKNILSICYDVGFNSKSTFNHCFKKHAGLTPTEFRKLQQQEPTSPSGEQ